MDALENFRFHLQQRIEAGEMSPKETLEAIQELVSYASSANEYQYIGEEALQTREQCEQAYLKRENQLASSRAYRALARGVKGR